MLTNDQPYMNLDFALNSSAFLGTGYLLPNDYQLNNAELEIASYYDSYSFLNSAIVANSSTLNALTKADAVCAASFPTGNITMASDGTRLFSAYYYDIKGNVTQQYETMLDGVVMKTETTYSFTDKPMERTSTLISGGKEYPVTETFEYDQYSDKLKSDYMYNYYYDNLGRVNYKYSDNYMEVQYRYDVRDWMTVLINRSDLDEVFSEQLVYNDTYFNGNMVRELNSRIGFIELF